VSVKSRNHGAEIASGDAVTFIDDNAVTVEALVEHLSRS
jgi:hypothetical protein